MPGPEFHLGIPLCCLLWAVAHALATDPRFSSGCFRADSGYRVFACGYRVFLLLTGILSRRRWGGCTRTAEVGLVLAAEVGLVLAAEVGLVLGPEFHLGIPLCCLLWAVAHALATDPRFGSGCFCADSGYRVFACGYRVFFLLRGVFAEAAPHARGPRATIARGPLL